MVESTAVYFSTPFSFNIHMQSCTYTTHDYYTIHTHNSKVNAQALLQNHEKSNKHLDYYTIYTHNSKVNTSTITKPRRIWFMIRKQSIGAALCIRPRDSFLEANPWGTLCTTSLTVSGSSSASCSRHGRAQISWCIHDPTQSCRAKTTWSIHVHQLLSFKKEKKREE